MRIWFVILFSIVLVTGCSNPVDPKVKGAIIISLQDRGNLEDFQPKDVRVDWVKGGLDEIDKRMNDLISTMKFKGKSYLPNSDYVEAKYQYTSIYVFVNVTKPEKNIIVKHGNDYFTFEGSKESADNVISWTVEQRILSE
ncbi:hypothetical protein GCM10008018_64860 [Paenibacillus marchantiophytorum]|uniref:Lipoprotein n=1 Tax=Paenibacillus marchantiophytorum TaxID=1619310 RepID=A0ABQ1FGJ2_9BACL|nr:hypothetical protein [Paenibacillus marchantiophytorum]GGA10523.1 hypothetical protein GCM10008018_64860 [Paenibacillus marchantiophytorum]